MEKSTLRIRRLFRPSTVPIWAVFIWSAVGAAGKVERLYGWLGYLWKFAVTPPGFVVVFLATVVALLLCVVWPDLKAWFHRTFADDEPEMSIDVLAQRVRRTEESVAAVTTKVLALDQSREIINATVEQLRTDINELRKTIAGVGNWLDRADLLSKISDHEARIMQLSRQGHK